MSGLHYKPLTADTWPALENLFGAKGACGGCWCMYWRTTAARFKVQKGDGNKVALKEMTENGLPIGVLAFEDDEPVGWCAIAPRDQLVRFATSRVLRPPDETQVWSVHCFFMKKQYRGKGLTVDLLKAAVKYAATLGATCIEGYPLDNLKSKTPDVFAWTGLMQTFARAGFAEVIRRSAGRPIMRLHL
ncbi:MAG TPA: GNAT family N-acetyltransferase [Phnomibacter sp.]|nr:GNAT family N-acetyltransferase [Phnomibacter sp.]